MYKLEIIQQLKSLLSNAKYQAAYNPDEDIFRRDAEALEVAIAALRPVNRERVEQVWRGEWMFYIFGDQQDENDPRCQCSECGSIETPLASHRFCPHCGAPMTDEAVDIVIRRLEALHETAE